MWVTAKTLLFSGQFQDRHCDARDRSPDSPGLTDIYALIYLTLPF